MDIFLITVGTLCLLTGLAGCMLPIIVRFSTGLCGPAVVALHRARAVQHHLTVGSESLASDGTEMQYMNKKGELTQ